MPPGIVGREAQLLEVERFLDASAAGFAVLVLEGDAGIGKTTLWREARSRAGERGALVLSSRPSAAEAKLSFAAVADLLARVEGDAFAALPDPQRDALEVALLRRRPAGKGPDSRAVAAAFLTLIRRLAAEGHVILAVDDWQWLDPPSRRVFEFAARRLEDEPVGVVCSIRPPSPGWPADDRVMRVAVGPLSLAALGRIVSADLGRPLPRPALVRIAEASGGNPFYALEIARLTAEQGPERPAGVPRVPVPDDLRKLTAGRVRRLPPATRDAVLLAAVVSGPDRGSIDVDALAPAEEAGIVTVDAAGRIAFAHPLFAAAAYESVPAARRRELHRRAADLVAEPEERARQLALASVGADPAVAGQLDEGAASAAARGAFEAAADLAELASRLTPAGDVADAGRRLLAAARFHFDAGDLDRADELARQLLGADPSGSLQARALWLRSDIAARRSDFAEAGGLAAAALDHSGDDRELRAAVELHLVYCAVSAGNLPGAEPYARAALDDAGAVGHDGMLADALAVLTMAEFLGGRGLDRGRLERALEIEDPAMARAFMMRPRVIQGMLQLWTGELGEARRTLEEMHADLVARGQEGAAPMLAQYLVWAQVWGGELGPASQAAAAAVEAAELLDDPAVSAIALSASALVHAHDGHAPLARREAGEALAHFERLGWRSGVIWPLWALGLADLAEGNPAGVHGLLGPLAEQVVRMGPTDPVLRMFVPDEVEALVALGELDLAAEYLEPFERSAAGLDRAWAIAAAGRCRGALEAARGAQDESAAAFERALAAHDTVEMPLERARTQLLAGEAFRRFKQRGRARNMFEAALVAFEAAGAPAWADRARDGLARLGRPGGGGDTLTETERRLAELAASGLTNHEVAARAFVSVKTVEANLTRVYRKLGVRSRVGLANALREARGESPPA
ncbi:MAG TPA: AAA family ATPase [Gaiellales bacterium]|nr:AAA family ATPase [Gaiellales bacterium]